MIQDHDPPMGLSYLGLSADWAEQNTNNSSMWVIFTFLWAVRGLLKDWKIWTTTLSTTWCQGWDWPLVWTSSAQNLLCNTMRKPEVTERDRTLIFKTLNLRTGFIQFVGLYYSLKIRDCKVMPCNCSNFQWFKKIQRLSSADYKLTKYFWVLYSIFEIFYKNIHLNPTHWTFSNEVHSDKHKICDRVQQI